MDPLGSPKLGAKRKAAFDTPVTDPAVQTAAGASTPARSHSRSVNPHLPGLRSTTLPAADRSRAESSAIAEQRPAKRPRVDLAATRGPAPSTENPLPLTGQAVPPPKTFEGIDAPPKVAQALLDHGAVRLDKKDDHLPPTIIHLEKKQIGYELQTDGKGRNARRLGGGLQGKLRIARRDDGLTVAAKKYHISKEKFRSVERAETEYSIYQILGEGRHFAKAYDVAHTIKGNDIKSYLFMELIDGVNAGEMLKGMVEDDAMSKSEMRSKIKNLARQSIEAMADMHDKGVANPDFNPGAIMIEPNKNIKVVDFGAGVYYSPDERGKPDFDGFDDDSRQLGDLLVGGLGRALLGLPSAYEEENEEVEDKEMPELLEQFKEALPFEDDEGVKDDARSLQRLADSLKKGMSPRQLLEDDFFKD
jgi:serine/threonine protein kinase